MDLMRFNEFIKELDKIDVPKLLRKWNKLYD